MEGFLVLQRDGPTVVAFSVCVVWGAGITAGALRRFLPAGTGAADLFSLVLGGWMVPVLPICIVVLLLGILLGPPLGMVAAAVVLTLGACWSVFSARLRGRRTSDGQIIPLTILIAILFGSILLRLAFVSGLSLPLYFDSAEHYRIIQSLIRDYANLGALGPLAAPVPTYYHLGFHLLLAGIASISQLSLAELMLVSGQVVLATVPLSLFLIVHRETGSNVAGLLAVVLGALGWSMPSHALDWGKYPAIFALPVIIFVLSAAYLASRHDETRLASKPLSAIAAAGAGVAVLIHTRSAIILGMVLLAWRISKWWLGQPGSRRLILAVSSAAILAAEASLIARDPILRPVFDPYLGSGLWMTVAVGVLFIPGLRTHPRLALSSLLSVEFLLLGMFLPGPTIAGGTLLDRPFVEMLLFVPLAVVGAVGFVALTDAAVSRGAVAGAAAAALISLAIVVYSVSNYSLYPSDCCMLVTQDDLVALDWAHHNLPGNAHVLIASAEKRLTPDTNLSLNAATDAGVWIVPITGLSISKLAISTDFGQSGTLDLLCGGGVTDIYVGSGPQSFKAQELRSRPAWYTPLLRLPGAEIFHVSGCGS